MQKRYQYCMSGMFAATDQNHYEINIPSPHTYETEEEAMADGAFGYRFVLLPGGKGPQVVMFGEKAFALCFVIFTAFTGLVSVNAGPGALYESHTFRTILNVMLTAAAYVIAIDLVYNMMFNFSQRFYQSIVIEEAIAIIPFIVGLIILYVFSCGKTVADLMYFKTYEHLWVTFVIAACMIHVVCSFVFRMIRKDYYKKHPEEEPHYGTMYVYDLNKSKNDEGGDVDEKRESD